MPLNGTARDFAEIGDARDARKALTSFPVVMIGQPIKNDLRGGL